MKTINRAIWMSEQVYERPDISVSSEKVMFIQDQNVLYIAFGGSDDIEDWWENGTICRKKINLGGSTVKVHSGFWGSWLEVRNRVISEIRRRKPHHVRLFGHSKGGAIAQCAYVDLPWQIHPGEEIDTKSFAPITFGSPKVFMKGSIKTLEKYLNPPKHCINEGDPVTSLPRFWMGYRTFGRKDIHRAPWWKRIYIVRAFMGSHGMKKYKENFWED